MRRMFCHINRPVPSQLYVGKALGCIILNSTSRSSSLARSFQFLGAIDLVLHQAGDERDYTLQGAVVPEAVDFTIS